MFYAVNVEPAFSKGILERFPSCEIIRTTPYSSTFAYQNGAAPGKVLIGVEVFTDEARKDGEDRGMDYVINRGMDYVYVFCDETCDLGGILNRFGIPGPSKKDS